MNEFESNSNEIDGPRSLLMEILEEIDVEPEFLRLIITNILTGEHLNHELPQFPDVTTELIHMFLLWKLTNKKFEFNAFVSSLQVLIRCRDTEKAKQFEDFIEAVCSKSPTISPTVRTKK